MLFRIPSLQPTLLTSPKRRKSRLRPLIYLPLPLLLWLGIRQVARLWVQPEAVLVLGGSSTQLERERFAARVARQHPDLPIWVSSGAPNVPYVKRVFAKSGVDPRRLHLDYQAVDTVTNFTTLADDLQNKGIKSVYLITSDYHMRRAWVIGEIVLGSRGILVEPVALPTAQQAEPWDKTFRDGGRAVLWLITGETGAGWGKKSL